MKRSRLRAFWREKLATKQFRTAVSLHSHTLHSEESLAFVPRYLGGIPLVAQAIRQQEQRCRTLTGRALDFSQAFWRPREAIDLEQRQIQEQLGLEALVSLSDHDNIQAGSVLKVLAPSTPISVEWTIPFGRPFFHIGVHNLPQASAPSIMSDLKAFTAAPCETRLPEMLSALAGFPEVLIVMNHPMWDEARIGAVEHAQLANCFLERYGQHIHALELNGLRPWKENSSVVSLAESSRHPLISGGDRHGLEPNANLNLTNAQTFDEFVGQIRNGVSEILFMPQYREPLRLRMIETMWDIVRDYPNFPIGRRHWRERVFYRQDSGTVKPLSELWKGTEPWPVRCFLSGLRAVKSQSIRAFLRLALAEPREAEV
jgi:hypothetical protein